MSARQTVLVLGGGPDAEREVSIESARAVARALRDDGRFDVVCEILDHPTLDRLRALPGDAIFPAMHGPFGEGGGMQDLLELDGRPYIGSAPAAARLAMDKLACKLECAALGAATPPGARMNPDESVCPIGLPCVVKPVREGSSVGLSICCDDAQWDAALLAVRTDQETNPARAWMVERLIRGRELTVALLDLGNGLESVGVVEIEAPGGSYDFQAKYERDDTRYTVDPALPEGVRERIEAHAINCASAIGVRHLARADFMLDPDGVAWFLEINTMPGFTAHSLLPMAGQRRGIGMGALCAGLIERAIGEHAGVRSE